MCCEDAGALDAITDVCVNRLQGRLHSILMLRQAERQLGEESGHWVTVWCEKLRLNIIRTLNVY